MNVNYIATLFFAQLLALFVVYKIGYANGMLKILTERKVISDLIPKDKNEDLNSKSKVELDLYDRLNSVTGTKTSLTKVLDETKPVSIKPSKVSIPNRRKALTK